MLTSREHNPRCNKVQKIKGLYYIDKEMYIYVETRTEF